MPRITKQTAWAWVLLGCALLAAGALRLPQLGRRPLHNDEANQAYKAGLLLETGEYRYDPVDHHGPALYYLTLPLAWLRGQHQFRETSIGTYRGLTVFFGILLIPLLLLARDALGSVGAVAAGLLTAVSPAMVYFNRFYIQETLLVCFSFTLLLCLWRYTKRPGLGWAVGIGASAGLMHSAKETAVLAWAALGLALALTCLRSWKGTDPRRHLRNLRWMHIAVALITAGAISITLFTSFFTHWRGALDSVLTYSTYLGRAGGAENGTHHHPFWFYLDLVTYSRPVQRLTWGEDLIILCALVGAASCWIWPRRLQGSATAIRVLSLYTLLLTLIYSVIPYKTPWCLLSFWHGWILLAAVGMQVLVLISRRFWIRGLVGIAICLGLLQLSQRAVAASFRYPANQRNPYVYAQTTTDFMRLIDHIDRIQAAHPDGRNLRIHVIAAPSHTWPLPWYLRGYPNTRYWHRWEDRITEASPAVVVADMDAAERVSNAVGERYILNYYGLRPEVLLAGFYRTDAWDRFIQAQPTAAAPREPGNETEP